MWKVRAMVPLQEDPTLPVLSWIFVAALAFVLTTALTRAWNAARKSPSETPHATQSGVSTDVYRVWDLFLVFLLFLLFAGPLLMNSGEKKPLAALTPEVILTNIVFQFILAGLVVAVVSFRLRVSAWLGLTWKSWPSVFWIAPLTVLTIWGIFGGLVWAGYMDWMKSLGVDTLQESVRILQKSEDPALLGGMTFAALVAAPVCEEIVFRGYCYPVLKKYSSATAALVASSLVFASAHGNLPSALPLFLLGMLLVYAYERTQSLWAPVAAHFLFNAATVTMQFYDRWHATPIQGS